MSKSATATRPQVVHVVDSAVNGLHKLTELCRQGYLLVEVECLNLAGMMRATLNLADPDQVLVQAAASDDVKQALNQK